MHNMLDEGMALLRELVEIPSLSGQECRAVTHLVHWMAAHGFDASRDEVGNAVGILDGGPGPEGGETHDIVLLGHIDTVPGTVEVAVRDGKLFGRGTVDAKGPLAAFATAAAQAGPQPGWRIVVIGAVEEEAATSKGARHIAPRYRPALAVIGEPSGWNRVTLGYKGRLLAKVAVQRTMAHRSGQLPSACELAVSFWNRAVTRVTEVNNGYEKPWDQVLASLRSFSSADDGLTETARMELGFRLPLHVDPETLKTSLQDLATEVAITFSGEETAYRSEKDNVLVRAFLRAVREQGGRPSFVLKTGTSDMNVVGPLWRCPILAYGPGDSNLDHTPEEHVDLNEWERGVAVLARVLRQLPEMEQPTGASGKDVQIKSVDEIRILPEKGA